MDTAAMKNGVLCNLRIGRWNASTKLPDNKLTEVPKQIVRAMQDLIEDKARLKELATVRRMAKGELARNSIPFPIDGIWFVPKKFIARLDDRFKELRDINKELVGNLLKDYGRMKRSMKERYPDYYNPEKYPSPEALKAKYHFDWKFFNIAMPKKGGVLSPELYKEEQLKFQGMVKEMEEMTLTLVATRLHHRVNRLAAQCAGHKINSGTIRSIDRFLNHWDELWAGHVDEERLHSIIKKLRAHMKGIDIDGLKGSQGLQQKTEKALNKIMKGLENIPNSSLKRKLDI